MPRWLCWAVLALCTTTSLVVLVWHRHGRPGTTGSHPPLVGGLRDTACASVQQRHDWCPQRYDVALRGVGGRGPIDCGAIHGRNFIVFSTGHGRGGMGDRVLSLVDLLVVGHLINRTVLYEWTDESIPFWKYWQPGAYEVRWDRYRHCFRDDEIGRLDVMNRDPILHRIASEPLQKLFHKRVEVVHKNVAWVGLLSSSNPYHGSTLWRWWQGDVFPWWKQAWDCLLQPSAALLAAAEKYASSFRHNNVIGLQIRLNNPRWGDDSTRNELPFKDKIVDSFIYCSHLFARNSSRPRKYFVMSDLPEIHALVKQRVGHENVITVEGAIVHVERQGQDMDSGFSRIALEVFLLSKTAGNVIGRASNFGRIGALGNPSLPIGLNFLTDVGPTRPIDHRSCVQLNGRDVVRKGDTESSDPSRIRGILELERAGAA